MATDKQDEQGQGRALVPGRNGGTLRPVRDSARAAELGRLRWEKRGAAARQGLRDAAAELTKAVDGKPGLTLPGGAPLESEYDVMRVVTTAHALNASDPSAPGSVQSLNAVDRMAFPAPALGPAPTMPPDGMQINLGGDLARELLAELRASRAAGAASRAG